MKGWFLGEEVVCFKPLRHILKRQILDKIKISEELETEIDIEEIKFKGFVDPLYPNKIRIADKIMELEDYVIVNIYDLAHVKNDLSLLNENNIEYFKEFANDRSLSLSDEYKERVGFDLTWIEEDLKEKGRFVYCEGEDLVFNTFYFSYKMSNDLLIKEVLLNNKEIQFIEWNNNRCDVYLEDKTIITLESDYIAWLNYLNHKQKILWYYYSDEGEKVADFFSSVQDKIIIHPKIWNDLLSISNKDKTYLKELWIKDLTNNGMFQSFEEDCIVIGWRFMYVWDGILLKKILTPEGKEIESIYVDEKYLYLNKELKTPLEKEKPSKITDLIPGNFVSMIPKNKLHLLDILPHATQRYEQRVDETAYICQITSEIHSDVYYNGKVVEGAHTSDRRKIETKYFGYILSDKAIISVWRKAGHKKKKPKKKLPSSIKRMEKMKELFENL